MKFRERAVGDIYRMNYNALAKDPNSLANLDQDLPNYLQFQVPIFSLPENWLFCESWCDMSKINEAKTIDLCNNPATKRPKLETASLVYPKWNELDQQVRELEKQLLASAKPQEESKNHKKEL